MSLVVLAAPLVIPAFPAEGSEVLVFHETFTGHAWFGYNVSFQQTTDITTLVRVRSSSNMTDGQISMFYERAGCCGGFVPGVVHSAMDVEKSWPRVEATADPIGLEVITDTPPLRWYEELHGFQTGMTIANVTRPIRIVVMAAAHAEREYEVEVTVTATAPVIVHASAFGADVDYASRHGGFSPVATADVRAPVRSAAAEAAGSVTLRAEQRAYFLAGGWKETCLCTFEGDATFTSPFLPVPYPGTPTAIGWNRPPGDRRFAYVATATTDDRAPSASSYSHPPWSLSPA